MKTPYVGVNDHSSLTDCMTINRNLIISCSVKYLHFGERKAEGRRKRAKFEVKKFFITIIRT
ncbi:MAG: hypothetical protein F6K39_35485 [Okeania sp. SIO3B3]|nr:hypothetical protein [Okeania sp. SIO3B3]